MLWTNRPAVICFEANYHTQRCSWRLEIFPPIVDTTTGPGATRAALRVQVEHENKMKKESKEALVRDYSNRIASLLATSMQPKAGLKVQKLQQLTLYRCTNPSIYDGVQIFKELKDELANLHVANDADEHEKEIERMRDDPLLDNCTRQEFADKVNVLIRDHNPHIQVPYSGERLLAVLSSSSCRRRWPAKVEHSCER
eukprot:5665708-Pleurochrysis_carterae.AAC.1